jgi:uncharacterized membrane protein YtjA (UPF0391 family)
MNSWTIDALIVAAISALLGFAGVARSAPEVAWILVGISLTAALGFIVSDKWLSR